MSITNIFKACVLCGCLSATALAEDWTEFRGPTGQGLSNERNLPIEWSATNNVMWKQPIPGQGWSSPLVVGARVYLTSGVATNDAGPSLLALCLDASSGKILWTSEVFKSEETKASPIQEKNSHASSTPILEGERLYAHFGHNGIACLDLKGRILWRNNNLKYDPMHGNGGSPILVDDKIIYNADAASDPYIVALNKTTGELIWKVNRIAPAKNKFSFCTPLLITVNGRKQIITPGSGVVQALNPADGSEIWRVLYGDGYSVVPRPVYGHGMIYISTGFDTPELLAIRVDGQGDVTDTHVAWRLRQGAPLTPSLLLSGDELYAVSDSGMASCLDAATGKIYWKQRVAGNYSSSPVLAEGRIYLQNEKGTGTVLKAGKEFVKLATNSLGEPSLASYALADHSIFIRTKENLYRIGARGNGVPLK